MNISVVTVFPELYDPFLRTSLIRRAQEQAITAVNVVGLLEFVGTHERIDAPAFGPGAGMVLRPLVMERAVTHLESLHGASYKIFFSPRGRRLDQRSLRRIQSAVRTKGHLMLLPARYEGMDERIEDFYADEILSAGDMVLMGGDLPAMMLIEGLLRLFPGVVGNAESVERDSFSGPFVDFPSYTEPACWQGMQVPAVLRSGNHKAIEEWRSEHAIRASVICHFEWLRSHALSSSQKAAAHRFIPKHYLALEHGNVRIGGEAKTGTTSVTSIDLHDIARAGCTFGIEQFFVITPLVDQQKIVQQLLDFWQDGPGITYNPSRHEALRSVCMQPSLADAVGIIREREKKEPLVIATSARDVQHPRMISFYDQSVVWAQERPVLIVLGTGRGLTDEFIASTDYLLAPIEGFTQFNHLSVRSAAAILLDRWLGINPRNEGEFTG